MLEPDHGPCWRDKLGTLEQSNPCREGSLQMHGALPRLGHASCDVEHRSEELAGTPTALHLQEQARQLQPPCSAQKATRGMSEQATVTCPNASQCITREDVQISASTLARCLWRPAVSSSRSAPLPAQP